MKLISLLYLPKNMSPCKSPNLIEISPPLILVYPHAELVGGGAVPLPPDPLWETLIVGLIILKKWESMREMGGSFNDGV